jgi:bifunctional DNA-binding transcriptional regulator/antitoxin component of YhaV-PrlF toxin-antitoxin module
MRKLLVLPHLSKKGSSLRLTPPKKVQAILGVKEEDILRFYVEDGKVILKKIV